MLTPKHTQGLNATSPLHRQRGAGALIVVLVLFFVMSLVAAYSSRNMIFEQKTSANQYRSTQAFEAAEAGMEWALAMLNTGRIDDACLANNAGTNFRDRFFTIDPTTGAASQVTWNNAGTATIVQARCVRDGTTATGWACNCPTAALPSVTPPAATTPTPVFQVNVLSWGTDWIQFQSQGCTRLSGTCPAVGSAPLTADSGEATAVIKAVLALKGAISAPPAAALTAGGTVTTAAAMQIVNTDPLSNGITIDARGTVAAGASVQTLPGSPSAGSIIPSDSHLPSLPNLLFTSIFGTDRNTYQSQPAMLVRTCPAQCTPALLLADVNANPGRMLWLVGNVNLSSTVSLGTATSPVVVVIEGQLTGVATAQIFGLVYTFDASGTSTFTGSPFIQGAVVVENDLGGTGTPTIVYDPDILRRLRLTTGSFVRVPGGWQDN